MHESTRKARETLARLGNIESELAARRERNLLDDELQNFLADELRQQRSANDTALVYKAYGGGSEPARRPADLSDDWNQWGRAVVKAEFERWMAPAICDEIAEHVEELRAEIGELRAEITLLRTLNRGSSDAA